MGSVTHDPRDLHARPDPDGSGGTWYGREPWWKAATFYQVYPASFKDSNGDGWGDIPGLVGEIDHLHDLGVDVVWLSPVFESPQRDMGYDVSDYQTIYAPYGSIADVDALVRACHDRGMKLILDLVVNHTSVEHAWFKESRSSKTNNPKRDWYIWKPARYDAQGNRIPPTNWRSYFAGPTWTWDEHTQEYYLHLYAPDQPDLNWESEACREAIYEDTMRFWLRRGVDGFRIDTVNKYSKRTEYADAPVTDPSSPHQPAPEMWCNGPRIHDFIRELREKALAPYGAVSVGELSNTPDPAQVLPYVSAAARELDMVFEFSMIRLGTGGMFGPKYHYVPFELPTLKRLVEKWQTFIEGTDGWTTVFCENHDNGRAVSRFGDCSSPALWLASAKALALWQATLTGSLFLYQGQEIGMTNMPAAWGIDEYKDIESLNFYAEAAAASGRPGDVDKTMHGLRILARDHARLPFQWDDGPNAGFSSSSSSSSTSLPDAGARPWMRVHDDYREINAARQRHDPDSVLSFYRRVLRLRKQLADVLVFGSFRLLAADDAAIFAYVKQEQGGIDDDGGSDGNQHSPRKVLVVLNFSRDEQECLDVCEALGMQQQQQQQQQQPTLVLSTADKAVSYASVAASGPKQTPEEAAAPQPPQIIPNESASSTASLIDVDTPSVHTVSSDFEDQPVKTETQQARIDLEEAAHRARAEADLAKKKTAHKARRADAAVTGWFENLSDEASTALIASNFAAIVGLGSYLGYKAYGLYERGRLTGKNVAVGLGIVAAVAAFEGVFGGYLYKGKKQSKK